jgi:hypothetical protein
MYKFPDNTLQKEHNAVFFEALNEMIGAPEDVRECPEVLIPFIPRWCHNQLGRALNEYIKVYTLLQDERYSDVPELFGEYIIGYAVSAYADLFRMGGISTLIELDEEVKKELIDSAKEGCGMESDEEAEEFVKDFYLDFSNFEEWMWDVDYYLLDHFKEEDLRGSMIDQIMGIF